MYTLVKNTGKDYESLTEKVYNLMTRNEAYTSVEKDVYLDSPDGPRQFDVILRSNVAGMDLLTVIECRDYAKNLSVSNVDGLYSKAMDVNASKSVLVAKKGFSKTAYQKASRLGVELCTVRDINRDLANIGLQVPILFTQIEDIQSDIKIQANLVAGTTITDPPNVTVNGVSFEEFFNQQLASGSIRIEVLNEPLVHEYCGGACDKFYLFDSSGNPIKIDSLTMYYVLSGKYYFGYVHDLPNTVGISNLSKYTVNIFFKTEDVIFDYKKNLREYKKFNDVPKINKYHVGILEQPELKPGTDNTFFTKIEPA